jgi:glyoxylase-like metal-dependent hydrolase (beta-lactamase superfamily II)
MKRNPASKLFQAAFLAANVCLLALIAFSAPEDRPTAPSKSNRATGKYEVYALRYGSSPGFKVSNLVKGADPTRTADVPFMFWVLKGSKNRNVLIDAGCYRGAAFERWKLSNYVKPSAAVGKVGLRPEDITDVILTHVHWDHIGGADLFPKAHVWMQQEEFTHHVDSDGKPLNDTIEPEDAAMLMEIKKAGRLTLIDGDAKEILPGIKAYTGGKHTYSIQYVGVQSAAGTIVIASDNIYMYENLDKHLPLGLTGDSDADSRAQARMLTIASNPRFILPGHDPGVFERFARPGNGVARIE